MQATAEPERGPINKAKLLGLVTAAVVGIVAPILSPHVPHPSMIYHVVLHIAGLTIAVFLGIVSILAYGRSATRRMLMMSLGFLALVVVELLYLFDVTGLVTLLQIPATEIELPHIVLLFMISMFGMGVLRINK